MEVGQFSIIYQFFNYPLLFLHSIQSLKTLNIPNILIVSMVLFFFWGIYKLIAEEEVRVKAWLLIFGTYFVGLFTIINLSEFLNGMISTDVYNLGMQTMTYGAIWFAIISLVFIKVSKPIEENILSFLILHETASAVIIAIVIPTIVITAVLYYLSVSAIWYIIVLGGFFGIILVLDYFGFIVSWFMLEPTPEEVIEYMRKFDEFYDKLLEEEKRRS